MGRLLADPLVGDSLNTFHNDLEHLSGCADSGLTMDLASRLAAATRDIRQELGPAIFADINQAKEVIAAFATARDLLLRRADSFPSPAHVRQLAASIQANYKDRRRNRF